MSAVKHVCGFEVIDRDGDGKGSQWLASCRCGAKWTGENYAVAEDQWRMHYHAITGVIPKPMGDKNGRWMP